MKALLISIIALSSSLAFAEGIGQMAIVRGDVKVIAADGSITKAKQLLSLSIGDKVTTGAGSYVKLLMKDDSVFQVGPNSEFSLENFEFETKEKRTAVYNLSKGQLRSWFVHKSPEKTLTIKTPTASMGIRGTEILTDVYHNRGGEVKTDIALVRGKLEVASVALGGKVMMAPGQLLDGLGQRLAGRAPASAQKALLKNLPKKVFDAVRKNTVGARGAIFLHDARQKFGGEISTDKVFDSIQSKGRGPASVPSAIKPKTSKSELNVLRKKISNTVNAKERRRIRQRVIASQMDAVPNATNNNQQINTNRTNSRSRYPVGSRGGATGANNGGPGDIILYGDSDASMP